MPSSTAGLAIPYPIGTDDADIPGDIQALADRLEALLYDGDLALASAGDLKYSVRSADHGRWLKLDGRELSQAEIESALSLNAGDAADFVSLMGTGASSKYGAAAAGKVKLLDMRRRMPMSAGPTGDGSGTLSVRDIGAVSGAETVVLVTANLPAHTHSDGTLSAAAHTHGPGTLTVASHSHGDGSLAAAAHSHGPGTLAVASHTHGPGTLVVASHTHGDGTLAAASHSHNIYAQRETNTPTTGAQGRIQALPPESNGNYQRSTEASGALAVTGATDAAAPSVNGGATAGTAPAVSSGATATEAPDVTGSTGSSSPAVDGGATGSATPDVTGATGSTGSDSSHDNMPPFGVLGFAFIRV